MRCWTSRISESERREVGDVTVSESCASMAIGAKCSVVLRAGIVSALLVALGCASAEVWSDGGSVSVATAQAFHAALGDMIHGSDLPIQCWVSGFPTLASDGTIAVDAGGHMRLPPLSWTFVMVPPPSDSDPGISPHYQRLLAVVLVPHKASPSGDVLTTWRECDVVTVGPDIEQNRGLEGIRRKLLSRLKAGLR